MKKLKFFLIAAGLLALAILLAGCWSSAPAPTQTPQNEALTLIPTTDTTYSNEVGRVVSTNVLPTTAGVYMKQFYVKKDTVSLKKTEKFIVYQTKNTRP